MIDRVVIRNFKRFERVEFALAGRNVVLAGPNNGGKTTVLQAISAWSFAFQRWQSIATMVKQQGWQKVPITRQQFYPLSVGALDSLWYQRLTGVPEEDIVIEVTADGRTLGMEFLYDTQEQMFVRPTAVTTIQTIQENLVQAVFVPSMTGMVTEEPEYKPAKLEQMLGQNRPGEVLRNLLIVAEADAATWASLTADIEELFGICVLPPDSSGADIVAECFHVGAETPVRLDIASCGSGFQQVLMLLTFLGTRRGAVLLLDEPDAHLHVFLQERIHQRLSAAAARMKSQLVIATHSEVILDAVEHDEIYVLLDQPTRLVDGKDVQALKDALRVIDHNDLAKARVARGVLYLEGPTDLAILREWARVLGHPAAVLLGPHVYWRKVAADRGHKRPGISAEDHFAALQLARPGYPGFQLVDGDSRVQGPTDRTYGTPPKRRWRRYEIESYLVQPVALERFVERRVGAGAASVRHRADLRKHFEETYPPAFLRDPLADLPMLANTKARTDLIPPALAAAGLPGIPYTEYHEIAALMLPAEIHPEIKEKLDAICTAFGVPLQAAP